jgi:acyl carrier protein
MLNVTERVIAALAELLNIEKEHIYATSNLTDDLRADSLDYVELIMQLEEDFQVEVTEDDALKFVTVADVITFIESKI